MVPLSSAAVARPRDRAAEFWRRRLRYQSGAPTRVGSAALGTAERRTKQFRVESVRRRRAATSAMLFKCDAVPGAAARAGALMHNTVIRQRHARRAEPKAVMHLLLAISLVQTIRQCLAGNGEGPGQQRQGNMAVGGRNSFVGVDRAERKLLGHDVPWQGVHARELSSDAQNGLVGTEPPAIEDVPVRRAQPSLIEGQDRQHDDGPTVPLSAYATSRARPAATAISLRTASRACT